MLLKLVFSLFCIGFMSIRCNEVSQELMSKIQDVLNKIPIEKIPDKFKSQSARNDHWCCNIHVPIKTNFGNRVESYNIVGHRKDKCGRHKCGVFGWKRCDSYCDVYYNEVRYKMEGFTYTEQEMCPAGNRVCCNDYFFIIGHCYHINEVQRDPYLLAELKKAGVVIGALEHGHNRP